MLVIHRYTNFVHKVNNHPCNMTTSYLHV